MDILERVYSIVREGGYTLTEKASQSLTIAAQFAQNVGRYHLDTEHLIFGLVKSNSIASGLFYGLPKAEEFLERIKDIGGFVQLIGPPRPKVDYLTCAMDIARARNRTELNCTDLTLGTFMRGAHPSTHLIMMSIWNDGIEFSYGGLFARLKRIAALDSLVEDQRFLITHDGKEFHFLPFDFLEGFQYASVGEGGENDLIIARAHAIERAGFFRSEEIEELEWLINRRDVTEYDLHRFFEVHPTFLLGTEYKELHSQLVLENEGGNLIPDFFVEKIGSSFADIIDLKKPNARLVTGPRNRRGFSSALTLALNQLREYRNYFDDIANRKAFYRKYGFTAFRPHVSVIIGRQRGFKDELERIKISDEYKNLEVLTYDDLLQRARHRQMIARKHLDIPPPAEISDMW